MHMSSYRKGLVLGIIILFVGASVIPSISGNIRESISVKDVDHFDNSGGRWAPEQINEADEDKKYELKHCVVFSKDDLVFDTLMGYDIVKLKDGTCINEIGKPMLPAKQIKIAVPAGMEVKNVHVVNIEREELPGTYNIFPAQPPVRTGSSEREISLVKPDAEICASSKPYPPEDVKLIGQTDLAGQGIAIIQLHPLQYIPSEKKLMFSSSITFTIECVDGYKCGDYLPESILEDARKTFYGISEIVVSNGNRYEPIGSNIQVAIDSLENGGTVWLPSGHILEVDTTIKIPDDVHLTGFDSSSIIKLSDYSNCNVIENSNPEGNSGIKISHLKIDANGANQAQGEYRAIFLDYVTDSELYDLEVQNSAECAIWLKRGENNRIAGCTVHDTGLQQTGWEWRGWAHCGIWVAAETNTIVEGNYLYNIFADGIVIATTTAEEGHIPCENCTVRNNQVQNCTSGIWVETGNNIEVYNNQISKAVLTEAYRDGGQPAIITYGDYNNIHNNIITDSTAGIAIDDGYHNEIFNNEISNVNKKGVSCVAGGYNTIKNNKIFNTGDFGIAFWNSNNQLVEDNYIDGTDSYGIQLNHVNSITIEGNTIINSQTGGINAGDVEKNHIGNNTITGAVEGIKIGENSCTYSTIIGNAISDCNIGLYFYALGHDWNIIIQNNLAGNENPYTGSPGPNTIFKGNTW